MPTRPDLRDLATNIRDALADCTHEQLLEMLTFVFKEYVVESPPPLLVHQVEAIADLQGLSFAALISTLQTRLDVPELALFQVDGEQVSVRIAGTLHALQPPRTMPPLEPARPAQPPQPGIRVVEAQLSTTRPPPASPAAEAVARGRGDLVGGAAAPAAPRPTGGVSLRGAGTMTGTESRTPSGAAPGPAAERPATPPAPAPASAQPDKPSADADDTAARFSLLELD